MNKTGAKKELKNWIEENDGMDSALFDYRLNELILSLSHKVTSEKQTLENIGHFKRQQLRKELKHYAKQIRGLEV